MKSTKLKVVDKSLIFGPENNKMGFKDQTSKLFGPPKCCELDFQGAQTTSSSTAWLPSCATLWVFGRESAPITGKMGML